MEAEDFGTADLSAEDPVSDRTADTNPTDLPENQTVFDEEDPAEGESTLAPAPAEGANATVVFDTRTMSRRGADGPTGKLIVLKGPKQGAEFTLGPGETTIGRNADNTIVIPDISVSRRHVVLVKEGAGYVLQDQGSGNGTLINGSKVSDHPLQDGDVFSIGDTEIQYVSLSQQQRRPNSPVPPARRAPSRSNIPARPSSGRPVARADVTGQVALPPGMTGDPRRKRMLIIASATLGLLVLIGILVKRNNDIHRMELVRTQQAAEESARLELANSAFAEGKQLVGQGRFAEALPKFNDAKEKGSDDPELDDYISRCNREMPMQKALADAADAIQKNQLASAAENVKKVPRDSFLSDKADEVRKQIAAAIPGRVNEARVKMNGKDYAGANAILDDAAKADPGNKMVSDMQDEVAKAEHKPPPVHITQSAKVVDHSGEIVQAFKDGDLRRAKDLAAQYGVSDDNIKRLGQELGQFEAAYGKMDDDPSAFRTAHDIDLRISKGHSFFSQKINGHVLSVSLKQCATAKSAGKLGEAYRACQAARDADPNNTEANSTLAELRGRAKDIYLEGYQLKDSDAEGARHRFTEVVNITPASDEWHQKAQQRLNEMK